MSSIKCHTRYRLRSGAIVPSVTTIIDSCLGFNKRALIAWARREALAGNDPDLILLDTGSSGTCTHKLIEAHILGQSPQLGDFTQAQVDAGNRGLSSFVSWEKSNPLEYVHVEKVVISEKLKYGGTIDLVGSSGGKLILIDLKTSKAVYLEMIVQVAAYGKAFEEQEGQAIDGYEILQLRDGFQHHRLSPEKVATAWEVFLHCRALYVLQKKMKGFI